MQAIILIQSKNDDSSALPRALFPRNGRTRLEHVLEELTMIKRISRVNIYCEVEKYAYLLKKIILTLPSESRSTVSLIPNPQVLSELLKQVSTSVLCVDGALWTSIQLKDVIEYHLQSKKITPTYIYGEGRGGVEKKVPLPIVIFPPQKNNGVPLTIQMLQTMFDQPDEGQDIRPYNAGTGAVTP